MYVFDGEAAVFGCEILECGSLCGDWLMLFLFGELTVMASFEVGLGLESLPVFLVLARRARVASGVGGWIGGISVRSV